MHEIIRQGEDFEVHRDGKTELKGKINQFVLYRIEGNTYATRFSEFEDDAELLVALASRINLN